MNAHDELDLLSPYLDGELDAAEQARLDAHLPTCADCREMLAGLRAVLADLKELPEPAPTPQDSWALRAAIRRARSPMRRWQRVSWAAGAVAAAAIAFVVMTVPGDGSRDLENTSTQALSGVPLFQTGENLTAADAQARLLDVAGIVQRDAAAPSAALAGPTTEAFSKDSAGSGASIATPGPNAYSAEVYATADDSAVRAAIERCVEVVRSSTQEFLEPIRFDLATFEDKPAFLLFFRTGDRYELWVTSREKCDILYFSQAGG